MGERWCVMATTLRWPMQAHGSYYALHGGSLGDALVDLTGGVGLKIKLEAPAQAAHASSGEGAWVFHWMRKMPLHS